MNFTFEIQSHIFILLHDISAWMSRGLFIVSLSRTSHLVNLLHPHAHTPVCLVFKTPIFTISVSGTIIYTTTHCRKWKSATTAPPRSYTAPWWETSASLWNYLSVCLSPPLLPANSSHVGLSNSQLCLLHSGSPLGSVCVQSPRAVACKLYPGKKVAELGDLRAPHVSFPSLRDHCPVLPVVPWGKAL